MCIHVHIKVIPLGVGTSISDYVAEAIRTLRELGYSPLVESGETAVEVKDLKEVGEIVKHVNEKLARMGVGRVLTFVSIDYRTDKARSVEDKISIVRSKLK
ncbi:MAG: MTH1187 family thiamine-binding protein [Desulfurococcales archaeon]|nr:MTH1187 family thiamine-binding protein [Desulfurococcales archaeon]